MQHLRQQFVKLINKPAMKKIMTTVTVLSSATVVNAGNGFNDQVFSVCAGIFILLAILTFIINFLQKILDHRLKNRILDKGIPENLVTSLLQPKHGEEKNINIKWFAILAGLGAGLLVVYYTQPLDIHSLAIMAFSISLSFLGYYFFTRKSENSRDLSD
jgi:hypothetical protein